MKTKILLIIALLFALIFATASCNNTTHTGAGDTTDGNGDAVLDTSLYLPLAVGDEPTVTIVSAYSKSKELASAFNTFVSCFKSVGVKVKLTYSVSEDPDATEILVGDRIYAEGDLFIDPHSLGDNGLAIKVCGNRLVVAGGTDASLIEALNMLAFDILGLGDEASDARELVILRSTDVFLRQFYPIKSITVAGNDLSRYDIVCDIYSEDTRYCGDTLSRAIYDNAGYWLNVKNTSTNPSIIITLGGDAGDGGFRVYVDGEDLVIACAYPLLLTRTFDTFVEGFFTEAKRELVLSGEVYSRDITTIRYSDYGAVGDGVTDDYEAIKAAHNVANIEGLKVIADSGKTYNLGQHSTAITVKTDTVWEGATFIIDDSKIDSKSSARIAHVFSVESSKRETTVKGIKSLAKGQTNVGVTFDSPVLLYVVYDEYRQYIRYGNNADSGASQQEIILVDENGNVDPSTPILWDYPELTSVTAYAVADEPITLSGGKFITIANTAPREYNYYNRGISIRRSNVTLDGIEHYIQGEGDTGAPYYGFINISGCHNVLVRNTVLTGHKVYKLSSDSTNSMGTYDIAISTANQITFQNCRQSNSITDTAYWGIMGSNYCKNLTYDGCVFSRFDAHKGTHNATIINSEIGHQKLSIIGSGTLIVENTVVHGNNIVNLRSDYGSTWDGDMIFRNVTLKNTGTATLINGSWVNHYFGYTCHLPQNIIIDGITLTKGTSFYVLPKLSNGIDTDTVNGSKNLNKVILTEKITVLSNPNNYTYTVSSNTVLYDDVELIEE